MIFGFIGQGHRHKVMVTRSKSVSWEVPLTSKSPVYGPAKKKLRSTTWGVFKDYAVSFVSQFIHEVILSNTCYLC